MSTKLDIIIRIVKQDYPNYWEQNGKFIVDLNKIMEFRNKLAHSVVDVSDDVLKLGVDKGVGFIEWNKGELITDEDFSEWEVRACMVLSAITDIKRLLPFKERKSKHTSNK